MPYVYAAYKMGAFSGEGHDLDPRGFTDRVMQLAINVHEVWVAKTPHSVDGMKPVGLIWATLSDNNKVMQPHVEWFPWCSSRDKLTVAAHFFRRFEKEYLVIVHAVEKDQPFYKTLAQLGLLRFIGKIMGFFKDGQDSFAFQTLRRISDGR